MLEILVGTDRSNAVAVLDPESCQLRELKDVASVTFADGSVFPEQEQVEPETDVIHTLSGEVVKVKLHAS